METEVMILSHGEAFPVAESYTGEVQAYEKATVDVL